MFRKQRLQKNIERAVRFTREESGNGKPIILFDPKQLEIEIFVKIAGTSGEPKSIGTYPASSIEIGE